MPLCPECYKKGKKIELNVNRIHLGGGFWMIIARCPKCDYRDQQKDD
jgi:hypothetical protein